MPEEHGAEGDPGRFNELELAWIGEHLSDLRRSVSERRFRNWTLWISLAVGLAAYVAGYLLKSSFTSGPAGLLEDLLYTLGWALWTGVVVVALIEIIPAAKERQITHASTRMRLPYADEPRRVSNRPGTARTGHRSSPKFARSRTEPWTGVPCWWSRLDDLPTWSFHAHPDRRSPEHTRNPGRTNSRARAETARKRRLQCSIALISFVPCSWQPS